MKHFKQAKGWNKGDMVESGKREEVATSKHFATIKNTISGLGNMLQIESFCVSEPTL